MTVEDSIPLPGATAATTPPGAAYTAARAQAVLFDRSGEGRLRLTGADRASWLQGLVTNDVAALTPGRGCYAAYLTPQGRMICDLRVLALADALLLDLPASKTNAVRERFDTFIITEDVAVEDVTPTLRRLGVHGPAAAEVLTRALAGNASGDTMARAAPLPDEELAARLPHLEEHDSIDIAWPIASPALGSDAPTSVRLIVAGSRQLGVTGFDLYPPPDAALRLWDRLRAAGAVEGNTLTWDVLRIEAGTPVYGQDMGEDTIPLEAGIEDRAISFTKGCYVGQEIIIRVTHRGHGRVARRLVGLAGRAEPGAAAGGPVIPLAVGDPLLLEDGDREIGKITSAAYSPRLRQPIALGYVQRDFVGEGTLVRARHGGTITPLVVHALPFIS
jgi:folate-binding protein YgfZ